MTYDPKSALRGVKQGLKDMEPKPIGGLTDASGAMYQVKEKPEVLCFFLLEWLSGAIKMPEDMRGVESHASALRSHRRPDGGTYLGLYSGGQVGDDVVVYGDPLMETDEIIRCVHAFRRFHAEQHAGMPIRTAPKLVS